MHRLIISIPIQTAKIGGISIPNLQTPIYYYMVPESFMVVPSQHGLLVSWKSQEFGVPKISTNCAPKSAGCGAGEDGEADSCGTCGCTGGDGWWSGRWKDSWMVMDWFLGQDGVPQDVSSVPQALKEGWWHFLYRGNTRKRVKHWIIRWYFGDERCSQIVGK